MSKKMYYTENEAASQLHCGLAQLSNYVRDGKLRSFMDGARKMFKVEDVDALAATVAPASAGDSGEIVLSPADTGEISLSEADSSRPATKEDTVITAEGISIFDDEDLQIEAADPMAKTVIAPSIEDQTSLEGVGSGSGLLDLTRESDDTSLGAEVLDHIDMEGAVGSGIAAEIAAEPGAAYAPQPEMTVVEAAPDAMDASSGLFGGIAIGSAILMLLIGAVMLSAMQGAVPGFVAGMRENLVIVLVVGVVIIAIAAGAGFMMGKAVESRQSMKKIGG